MEIILIVVSVIMIKNALQVIARIINVNHYVLVNLIVDNFQMGVNVQ